MAYNSDMSIDPDLYGWRSHDDLSTMYEVYRRLAEERRCYSFPFCLDCEAEGHSLTELKELVQHPEVVRLILGADLHQTVEEGHERMGHQVAQVHVERARGRLKSEAVQEAIGKLEALGAKVPWMVQRFRDRRALSNVVVKGLVATDRKELLWEPNGTKDRHPGGEAPPGGSVPIKAFHPTSDAERDLSVAWRPIRGMIGGIAYGVDVQSGRELLNAVLTQSKTMVSRFEARGRQELERNLTDPELNGAHLAYLLDLYVCLFQRMDLFDRLMRTEIDPASDPMFVDKMGLEPAEARLLAGDLAVLQYYSTQRSSRHDKIQSLAALLSCLESEGYPRLSATTDKEPRQRVEQVLNAMAEPLMGADVHLIDWTEVFMSVRGRPRQKSRE